MATYWVPIKIQHRAICAVKVLVLNARTPARDLYSNTPSGKAPLGAVTFSRIGVTVSGFVKSGYQE